MVTITHINDKHDILNKIVKKVEICIEITFEII